MRYRAVAVALLALVFLIPMGTSQFSGQSDDGVGYRFGFSDTVTERNTIQQCHDYEKRTLDNGTVTQECVNSSTVDIKGSNTYVFDWDNVDVSRTDNGNIQVSAVMKPNDITKIIKKEDTPATTEQEAIDQLNQDYMWNGGDFDSEAYKELVETAKSPVVSVVDGGAAVQTNTAESVMSNSGRVEFTVVTDDQADKVTVKVGKNSGTVILTDETDFRPPGMPTALSSGVTPDRKGDSQYKSGSPAISDTLGLGYASGAYFGEIHGLVGPNAWAQYRYDNDAGFTEVLDKSGNDRDGTINGDPQATGGVWDSAGFAFDGSNDYVDVGSFDTDSSFTISTWIKSDYSDGGRNYAIANFDGSGFRMYAAAFDPSTGCRIDDGSNGYQATQSNTGISTWTHVVCRYDASSETLDAFINGELVDSADTSGNSGFSSSVSMKVGYGDNNDVYYQGDVDETLFFDEALTDYELHNGLWMGGGDATDQYVDDTVDAWQWSSGPIDSGAGNDVQWTSADVSHVLSSSNSIEMTFFTEGSDCSVASNPVTYSFDATSGSEVDTIDLSGLATNESICIYTEMNNAGIPQYSPLLSSIELDWQDPVSVASVDLIDPADNEVLETPQNIDETVNYEYEVNRSTPNSTDVELIRGGTVIDTNTQTTDFETYTYSEDLGPGTYSWKVNVTDNGDGTKISSNTRTFEIQEKVAVNVIPQTPSAGDTFTENEQVNASTDIENFRPDTVTVEQYFEDQDTGNTVTLPDSTVSSNTNKTVWQTDQINPGNYTAVTEVYDSSGNLLNSDSTGTFEVTPVPVKLQLNNPGNLKDYYVKPGETVNPSFSVDVTANESGTAAVKLGEAPDPDLDPGATLHNLGSHSGNGSTITYVNDSVTVSEGSYAWYAGYDNDSDATFEYTSSTSLFEVIEEQSPTVTWVNPVDGDTIDALQNTTNVSFEFDVDTNFDASINVTLNDTSQSYGSVYNDSHVNGSATYTFTKELAPGNYTATVNVTSSNTNNSYTNAITFEVVDANPNQLDELLIWVADQTGVPLDTIQLIFAALVIITVTSWVTIQTGSVSIGLVTSIITMGVVVSLGYLPVVYLIIAGLLALVLFLETETFG